MVRKAIVSLILIGWMCCVWACDSTPEYPKSGPAEAISLPKEKTPPTSKEDSTKNATAVIEDWLKLIDQGQYATCYDQTAPWLKQQVHKDDWIKQVTAFRTAFGPLISRKVKSVDYKTTIPRMPPGVYVSITYDSSFANVKNAFEEIGATYENGKWQPLGYYMGTRLQATPVPTPKS